MTPFVLLRRLVSANLPKPSYILVIHPEFGKQIFRINGEAAVAAPTPDSRGKANVHVTNSGRFGSMGNPGNPSPANESFALVIDLDTFERATR